MKDLVRLMRKNFVPLTLKALKSDRGYVVEWTESMEKKKVFKRHKIISGKSFKNSTVSLPSGFRTGLCGKNGDDEYTADELAEEITKRSIKQFFENIHLDPEEVDKAWEESWV